MFDQACGRCGAAALEPCYNLRNRRRRKAKPCADRGSAPLEPQGEQGRLWWVLGDSIDGGYSFSTRTVSSGYQVTVKVFETGKHFEATASSTREAERGVLDQLLAAGVCG